MSELAFTAVAGLVFLFFSAFFSASETALFSISRERVAFFKDSTHRLHRWVFFLLRDGQQTLLLILVGNLTVNILVVSLIHTSLAAVMPHNSSIATLALATVVILVFGEVLPKNVALRYNESFALLIAPALYPLEVFTRPALRLLQSLNKAFLTQFGRRLQKPSPFITLEELKNGVDERAGSGAISDAERDLINHLLDIGNAPVSSMTIHRSQVVFVSSHMLIGEVVKVLRDAGASYCLVHRHRIKKEIAGIARLPELLSMPNNERVAKAVIAPLWVPDSARMASLISVMVNQGSREVCVVDEFGAFYGVATIDSIRRGVGIPPPVQSSGKIETHSHIFDGFDELSSMADWVPESMTKIAENVRTVNGLITTYLGRIPKTGETLAMEGWSFYIIKAQERFVETILIRKKG